MVDPILLVQSPGKLRDELEQVTNKLGYAVVVCGSPEFCASLDPNRKFAVILLATEFEHAETEGGPLIQFLANTRIDTPIIITAGRNEQDHVRKALHEGACDYVLLPLSSENVLEHALLRAMERRELHQENRQYRIKLESANRDLLDSLSLLEQDQQAGRHVQARLLPHSPMDMGDFTFSQYVLPSFYLSGDCVDYFRVGDHHAVFFLADVSGHGASSAFVTVMIKNLFARKRSNYLHRNGELIMSPASMLERANRELLSMDIGKHVTMIVGRIDLSSGELVYSVAGHMPAPALRIGRRCEFLEGKDLPVGLFDEAEYEQHSVILEPDSTLTMFSDGILEVMGNGAVPEKEEQLLATLAAGAKDSSEVVASFELDQFEAAPDDIAVLVINRNK